MDESPEASSTQAAPVRMRPNNALSLSIAGSIALNSLGFPTKGTGLLIRSLSEQSTEIVSDPKEAHDLSKIKESSISLQKWEGRILQVLDNTFTARLTDLTTPGIEEEAEFSVAELSLDDLPLLQPDAIFYWSIGRHTDTTNRQRTVSELRFRRLPSWTPEELAQASFEASALAIELGIKKT